MVEITYYDRPWFEGDPDIDKMVVDVDGISIELTKEDAIRLAQEILSHYKAACDHRYVRWLGLPDIDGQGVYSLVCDQCGHILPPKTFIPSTFDVFRNPFVGG